MEPLVKRESDFNPSLVSWLKQNSQLQPGGYYMVDGPSNNKYAVYEDASFSPLYRQLVDYNIWDQQADAGSWMGGYTPLKDLLAQGYTQGDNRTLTKAGGPTYQLGMNLTPSDSTMANILGVAGMLMLGGTTALGAAGGSGAAAGGTAGGWTAADVAAMDALAGGGGVGAAEAGIAGGAAAGSTATTTASNAFDPALIGSEMGTTTATADPGFLSRLSSFVQGSGDLTAADLLKLQTLGKAGSGILGLIGAEKKEDAQEDRARDLDARTAPYRAQLAQLYANPEAYLSSPAVTGPVDQGTQSLLRGLSARHGNPFGSGTALQEAQNYAATALSRELGNEKARLAVLSGVPNAAAAYPGASQAAIDAGSGIYDVLGSTLYDITNPRPTLAQLLEEIRKMGGTTGGKVATGGYTGAAV